LGRHLDAEQRRGSPVDDEIELDGLLDGQFGGLGSLEDVAGIVPPRSSIPALRRALDAPEPGSRAEEFFEEMETM
jgi:hypothetical protein